MEKKLTMPRLKPDMETGVLCAWLKEPGESYKKGDVLYEVETDKVVSQVEATEDGVIRQVLAEEGSEVPAGQAVAVVE